MRLGVATGYSNQKHPNKSVLKWLGVSAQQCCACGAAVVGVKVTVLDNVSFKDQRFFNSQPAGGPGENCAAFEILLSWYSPCNTFHLRKYPRLPFPLLAACKSGDILGLSRS